MNELALKLISPLPSLKGKNILDALTRGELTDCLAELYRYLCDGAMLPSVPVEPLRMSADDEHVWIGLDT